MRWLTRKLAGYKAPEQDFYKQYHLQTDWLAEADGTGKAKVIEMDDLANRTWTQEERDKLKLPRPGYQKQDW